MNTTSEVNALFDNAPYYIETKRFIQVTNENIDLLAKHLGAFVIDDYVQYDIPYKAILLRQNYTPDRFIPVLSYISLSRGVTESLPPELFHKIYVQTYR